jgi:hypothetical protein
MRSAPLLVACIISLALTSVAAAQPARESYFLDFRARGGGILGHTFIVYGRMDERGRVLQAHHASLYPHDAYEESPVLSVALVPGYVTFKREDPKKPTLVIYRRKLNARQYAHLQLTIARLKTRERRWHMWLYNCNDFAGQVAREMDMVAPLPWVMPSAFVNGLRALNGP